MAQTLTSFISQILTYIWSATLIHCPFVFKNPLIFHYNDSGLSPPLSQLRASQNNSRAVICFASVELYGMVIDEFLLTQAVVVVGVSVAEVVDSDLTALPLPPLVECQSSVFIA